MSDPPRSSFDLLSEPWIVVRRLDGSSDELGILDVVRQASALRGIGGELPTTTFAVIRFLLAILHRSFVPDAPPTVFWGSLWSADQLPAEVIESYLSQFAGRFDLLHSETPFYQVADLRSVGGGAAGLERLIADVPNGAQFFTTRAGAALRSIPFAEAARWLLHANAFDVAGIKSGAVGDSRVKGGKGYPIGTAWCGNIGGVLLEGDTLRETLLLNLVLGDPLHDFSPLSEEDLPVWERPPLTAAVETCEGVPREWPEGPADLYTWPSRRMRLVHDGRFVTGVILAIGDPLGPQNQFSEPMTTWRRSENQEKKRGGRVYMPRQHDPARSMWRGLASLIPHGVREQQRAEGVASLAAGNLEWVRRLQETDFLGGPWLSPDRLLRTRAIGMEYGPQSSTVTEIVDDSLSVHAVLLGGAGSELAARAVSAVGAADLAVAAVVNLAGNLVTAAGGDNTAARDQARHNAYFILDAPFRSWLGSLDLHTDALEALFDWYGIARQQLRAVADEILAAAGPGAWVGRNNHLGRHVDTALADLWFRSALSKALPFPKEFHDDLVSAPDLLTQGKESR